MIEDLSDADREAEQAQVAIREGMDRARELLSERLAAVQQPQAEPPNPAG